MFHSVLRNIGCLVLAGCIAVCMTATREASAEGDGVLKLASGDVVRLRGQWMAKSRAADVQLPGGGRIRFHENADASVLTDPQSLMLQPGKKTTTYSVIIRRGFTEFDLPDGALSRTAIAIGTPSDVRLVTLSGHCSVKVDGSTVIVVSRSGTTMISQGTKLTRLPNSIKRVFQGRLASSDVPTLDATQWVGGRRVWIAASGMTAVLSGYSWAPVQGAQGYALSLSEATTGRSLVTARVSEPRLEAFREPVPPGKYALAVAAIDGDGFVSTKQTILPVTVSGLELPGGAAVLPNNTVLIAPEQQLKLTFAEGLTLTTANHKNGVAGTEPFGLEGNNRAVILIHPPNGGESSSLTLVQRLPLVSAWVGPKFATWPDDALALQVSFVDGNGRPTPREIEPTVRVYVGLEPIDVSWEKSESLWLARLPAVQGTGPWVVRLEVVDQYGVVIGRDFAEIARTRNQRRVPELTASTPVRARAGSAAIGTSLPSRPGVL